MPDDVAKLQKDVADLRGEMRRVWDNQSQLEKDLAELRQHQTDPNDVLRREELAEMQLKAEAPAAAISGVGAGSVAEPAAPSTFVH